MPLQKINNWIGKLEGFLLALILVGMIVLAFLQVILRNFFDSGISWADPVLRHLVLWVGFLGASVATKEEGHLAMDLVSRFLPDRLRHLSGVFTHLASSAVCGLLAHAAYKFVLSEKESGAMLVPDIPNYWAVSIIPIGFALMSLRFALRIINDIRLLVKGPA